MDDSKLKAICKHDLFYISLQDQKDAMTRLENTPKPPRKDLSRELTTHVYFAVHCDTHWAAVQLSISPFGLRALPGQKFFRSCFRYTWCCGTAQRADNSSEIFSVVQQIYDYYFQLSPWNFSSQYCHSSDPTPKSRSNETTCAKKIESALVGYMQLENDPDGDEFPLVDSEVDDVRDSPANRIKRRRFQEINYARNHDENDELDDEEDGICNNEGDGIRGDEEDGVCDAEEDGTGDDEEDGTGDDERNGTSDDDTTTETPLNTCSSMDIENVTAKAVETISNKIRKALDKMFPGKQTKRKASQLQVQARCIDVVASRGQLYSTDVILSDFKARFARGEFTTKDRFLYLENLLWKQSSTVRGGAQQIAWKGCFVAACVRKIRHHTPTLSEEAGASQSTITRWSIAAWMINLIVDGLWQTWGPKAALVYEALALKNYSLSRIVKFSENILRKVIQGVVNNLRDSTPLISYDTYVFHPAACLSSALDIGEHSYEETCFDLGLESSFLKLDPPQNLQSNALLSLLSDQWGRYLATLAIEPVTSTQGHDGRGASISSQFDALTAVAQSMLAIGHLHDSMEQSGLVSLPTAPVESSAVEDADAEQSVYRDSRQHFSQANVFNLQHTSIAAQHTNYSTPSIRDQQTHVAASSSTLEGLASCSDTPTDLTLHALVRNGTQGVAREPGTRMIVEREALHLGEVNDLVNCPSLCGPVQFGDLWGADNLSCPNLSGPVQFGDLWGADDLNCPNLCGPVQFDDLCGADDLNCPDLYGPVQLENLFHL